MKNIHVIPTDKPSRLHITGNLGLYPNGLVIKPRGLCKNQHMCITSDEQGFKGDWVIHIPTSKIIKVEESVRRADFKKILLTTNPELIADGVQAIDDTFLEWFVKNPGCEFVEIENDYLLWKNSEKDKLSNCYKIIIPKEEPKQDLEKEMFELEQELDIPSHLRWHNSKPKQETLEEVAFRKRKELGLKGTIEGFIAGFKACEEQNKNMYSEDEVKQILIECCSEVSCEDGSLVSKTPAELYKWIKERFKKK